MTSSMLACLWAVTALTLTAEAVELEAEIPGHTTILLQQRQTLVHDHKSGEHYWPHGRGKVGQLSQTPYVSMPESLNHSFAWRWDSASTSNIIWGTLIDRNMNLYVASMNGITKLSPSGQVVWTSSLSTEMPSLVGNTLVGMRMMDCMAFALDLETGQTVWQNKLCMINGAHGDFVEAHNGIAVVGAGTDASYIRELLTPGTSGAPTMYAAGMNVTDGSLLWKFHVECGLWNIMALFPDDNTTVFMDQCGGLYRVGLRDGARIWHTPGITESFTDGGPIMGPDGSIYTCSNPYDQSGQVGDTGLLRKYRYDTGERLWSADLPYPCVNFPAVSMDGNSVVVAPGALATSAKTKEANSVPEHLRSTFYHQQLALVNTNQQRRFYGEPDIEAALMGFDAATGALLWRHDVKPWGGLAFAYDEQRAWSFVQGETFLPHCWPAHWSGVATDRNGAVYAGRSTGEFYIYDPATKREITYHTGDGILMSGPAFAPGFMAVSTCSSVFAFHLPG